MTVCDTPLDGQPSVDSTSSSRHRSIAGYRPTIVLIAASRSSVHNMRWSQILSQNPDFSLPHVHSSPPLGGGVRQNIAITFGTEKLDWCGYPKVKKNEVRSFFTECSNVTDTRADRRTDTVWRLRPQHRAAKNGNKTAKINAKNFHGSLTAVVRAQNDTSSKYHWYHFR